MGDETYEVMGWINEALVRVKNALKALKKSDVGELDKAVTKDRLNAAKTNLEAALKCLEPSEDGIDQNVCRIKKIKDFSETLWILPLYYCSTHRRKWMDGKNPKHCDLAKLVLQLDSDKPWKRDEAAEKLGLK